VLGEYRVRPGSLSGEAARMIRGNLRVYDKALAALDDRSEAEVARRMIVENRQQLAIAEAFRQVAEGDVEHGLPALRAVWRGGLRWTLAFLLWRVAPSLAPPMLRWREQRHSRGSGDTHVPPLGPGAVAMPEDAPAENARKAA